MCELASHRVRNLCMYFGSSLDLSGRTHGRAATTIAHASRATELTGSSVWGLANAVCDVGSTSFECGVEFAAVPYNHLSASFMPKWLKKRLHSF